MVDDKTFNYGKLYNFFKGGYWIQGNSSEYVRGKGLCYCLAAGLNEAYRYDKPEVWGQARAKLIEAIRKLYPSRTSALATKLANVTEPMATEKYSLVGFNDNPVTTFKDVLSVIIEAGV